MGMLKYKAYLLNFQYAFVINLEVVDVALLILLYRSNLYKARDDTMLQ